MHITRRHNIAGLLQHAIIHGARSTVLRPLGWLIGILATLVLAAIRFQAPVWMNAAIIALLVLGVSIYLSAFVYCLLTDKEALRTEKYSIQKLAIEKGFVGDNLATVFRPAADDELLRRHQK
jgi:hypothetical protein